MRSLLVPYQNALKLVLSVNKNIFPDEYLFTLKGTLFFNNSKFSFEIYPLISGLSEYSMGLL